MDKPRDPNCGYIDSGFWVPKKYVNALAVRTALSVTVNGARGSRTQTTYDYKESPTHIQVPREYWRPSDFPFTTYDVRPAQYRRTWITSRLRMDHRIKHGVLQPTGNSVQEDSVRALLGARGGVLQLACGLGKTCVALETVARLQVPALIVVDTRLLQQQWLDEIALHLEVPGGVGVINGDKFDWNKNIVVATYMTLANRADKMPEEVLRHFGVIFWDECHMVDAPVFCKSAGLFYGRRYGLSATPDRPDGLHVIHQRHLGPVLYKELKQELVPRNVFLQTGISINENDPNVSAQVHDKTRSIHLAKLSSYLGRLAPRRKMVLDVARNRLAQGGKVAVVCRSVEHLAALYAEYVGYPELLHELPPITRESLRIPRETGADAAEQILEQAYLKRQREYIQKLTKGRSDAVLLTYMANPSMQKAQASRIVFAVLKYVRQAYNDKALDTLILADPVSSVPLITQTVGRILRYKEGKQRPLFLTLEDDIKVSHELCATMRAVLINTPPDEGGPYQVERLKVGEAI